MQTIPLLHLALEYLDLGEVVYPCVWYAGPWTGNNGRRRRCVLFVPDVALLKCEVVWKVPAISSGLSYLTYLFPPAKCAQGFGVLIISSYAQGRSGVYKGHKRRGKLECPKHSHNS